MKKNRQSSQIKKTALICIDGLSWNLLDQFCTEGVLPNLAEFVKNGVSGELESIIPLISPLIWATIYTGKTPERHGVKDFYANAPKTKQIWEIMHENGEKIGVFNPLTAIQAEPVEGFLVPGYLNPTAFVHPADLKFVVELSSKVRNNELNSLNLPGYLIKLIRGGCRISTFVKLASNFLRLSASTKLSNLDTLYKLKECESLLYADIFIGCVKKYNPSFLVFYDNGIDCVSHWYWKCMKTNGSKNAQDKPVSKYRDVIKNYYVMIDKILGRIASVVDHEGTFVIVSDHGFEARSYGKIDSELCVAPLLHFLNIEDKVYGIKLFNGGLFRPKNIAIDLSEIEDLFKMVKLKENGKQVFRVATLGQHVEVRIDAKSITSDNQVVTFPNSSECLLKTIINLKPELSGDHSPKGAVVIISGPNISAGALIKGRVHDITPTILAIKGMPIAQDMDGKVLPGIFKQPIDEKKLKRIPSYDTRTTKEEEKLSDQEEEQIKERLKKLGYL